MMPDEEKVALAWMRKQAKALKPDMEENESVFSCSWAITSKIEDMVELLREAQKSIHAGDTCLISREIDEFLRKIEG